MGSISSDSINQIIQLAKTEGLLQTKDISDGYHTFGDLYHHRALLFASVLCMPEINTCAWKSKKHFDNETDPMYDGMFIVGFTTEIDGKKCEASYHYDIDPYWDKYFGHVKEIDHAPKFSGYTPEESLNNIFELAFYWYITHESERMWYEEDAIKKCVEDAMKTPMISRGELDYNLGILSLFDADGSKVTEIPIDTEESTTTEDKKENKKVTDVVIDSETGTTSFYNSEKEKITELSRKEITDIASHLGGGAMGIIKGSTADQAQERINEYYPWVIGGGFGGGGCKGGWGGNGKQGTAIIYNTPDGKPPKPKAKVRRKKAVKIKGKWYFID